VEREIQSIIKADAEDSKYANNLVQVCIINMERKIHEGGKTKDEQTCSLNALRLLSTKKDLFRGGEIYDL